MGHDGTLVNHCIFGSKNFWKGQLCNCVVTAQSTVSLVLFPFPLLSIHWENPLPLILNELSPPMINLCRPPRARRPCRKVSHMQTHSGVHTWTHRHTHTTPYTLPLPCSQVQPYSVQLVEHEKKMSKIADLALSWMPQPCLTLPCPETTSLTGADKSSLLGLRTEDRTGLGQWETTVHSQGIDRYAFIFVCLGREPETQCCIWPEGLNHYTEKENAELMI